MYKTKPVIWNREILAYLIGVGLGDGNLSKLNGRSVRLRIFCDINYPKLIEKIIYSLRYVLPESKISIAKTHSRCVVISSYSNSWENILGWQAGNGTKYEQSVRVPDWIWCQDRYVKACLQGLLETDGSIYSDRGYPMVMFANIVPGLASDVEQMISWFGFTPKSYNFIPKSKHKVQRLYHVRLSKNVQQFLNLVQPLKA